MSPFAVKSYPVSCGCLTAVRVCVVVLSKLSKFNASISLCCEIKGYLCNIVLRNNERHYDIVCQV